ncbi:Microcystin-dependent protein [Chitinophaga jiangningensis]|uniref:Microcystin-dependent protein n=1 Tax=Chitinophaga jiangningensis TaxID=1419482 RepID=A0A1M7J2N1_9BACT|nr:tail fiber protein [Chitinophaga jiangningensis]SHM47299.1 Microcystin-dependent protein [Chitinophaga jiangningensis]
MPAYLGEIRIFAGTFAPVGWAFCQGQSLSISENDALFQLIRTTYGGDGLETFNLPDLQGRVPLHMGTNLNGDSYSIGETGGSETYTLSVTQIPAHQHVLGGNIFMPAYGENPANDSQPANKYAAITPTIQQYSPTRDNTKQSLPLKVTSPVDQGAGTMMQGVVAGGSQPFSLMQPFLVVNYIICLQGIYPSQT